MSDTPKTGLETQIEQEAKELANVPKIPIQRFYGAHTRCHFCGQLYDPEEGTTVDTHIHPSLARNKCPTCGGANG